MNSSEIRQAFFDYFTQQTHQWVESSSLVPHNDPTLLFTNAGMVQFKDVFLGLDKRPYQRAVTSQRCVRAGGKHNDLENVGYTARHHTFFEMLGNFSFGDYFKVEAIRFAWQFLTQVLKLPVEKLWVTVYQDDDEAAAIWLNEIGVPADRISRCGEKDNFWSMGDTGPCGPCTEIFYDHGPEIAGGPPGSADADGDRYIEIWNLVFMQFNRDKEGQLHPLPKPSVDTGMGLERIAAVVQGVHNNYDIDTFQYLIQAIIQLAPKTHQDNPSLKVIADHIRACSFLIADGVLPSNEGRGYVLRRIIRRAVRHGHQLALPMPFFHQLVAALVHVMGDAYPELKTQQTFIEQTLLQEENQFARTLDTGLKLLREQMQSIQDQQLPGEVAFKLYDTYGFPLDLTEDILREHHWTVDQAGFDHCMQQQRTQSQTASQFNVDYTAALHWDEASLFQGYEQDSVDSELIGIVVEGQKVEQLTQGMKAGLVLNETSFYAESGGQVGDKGYLFGAHGRFQVDDTQKQGSVIVHFGEVLEGTFTLGEKLCANIDIARRQAIRLNHTATHLLHAALKRVLGTHVQQKGSLVDAERARFDFSHNAMLAPEQLQQLEKIVNEQIRLNHPVETKLMSMHAAKDSGAVALFGEKYGDAVRVLSMSDFSKELCGGTHARQTGDIGLFKITAEYGVASGVRRLEFVTGHYALDWIQQQETVLNQIAQQLKSQAADAGKKLAQTLQTMKQQEKDLQQLNLQSLMQSSDSLLREVKQKGDVRLLMKQMDQLDMQGLRSMLDQLRSRLEQSVIVLWSIQDDKMQVLVSVSPALKGRVPTAVELVKHLCGKGGGRDDMAQGGSEKPADLDEKLTQLEAWVGTAIGA